MKRLLVPMGLSLISVGLLRAQDTVRVKGVYDAAVRPGIVVLPTIGALDSVRAIIARDLDYGDGFEVIVLPPQGPVEPTTPGPINYALYRDRKSVV